ncbi:TonB-dependent receptor [Sphingobium sp. HBC34]|uniref:TonB-dependent receptor n=1 Tax=Sphingobium cyanobacteriorum TaxID=3063954 RepID=A0ABT8ZRQ3_9SPHN|nr:TonB-dependent receptor [Sphingobium sp. HBC34]MDO7836395.1 TonB-dependent receptor [Sphingobium sp. HBC34]
MNYRANNARAPRGHIMLATTASLMAMVIAAPAFGQDAGQAAAASPAGETDIVVTGIRGSLQRNLDIKRTSSGVVDVISAEDIGKFPDSNVAASLQRLPGVSIQRSGSRGEPQGISVRGFGGDFNETLIDGRRLSTASGGRSVDFTTVGADFVGQLAVYKTPEVSLSSSSIGATLNISYPKPFDKTGTRMAFTAAGSVQDEAGKVVPTVGGLFSTTFADDTMGILVDAVYTRRDTQANRVYVSGWQGGKFADCQLKGSAATICRPSPAGTENRNADEIQTRNGWYQQQYGADQRYTKDERIDGRIAFQWQPSDDVVLTIDDNYSRQKVETKIDGFGIWFNQGDMRNVELDGNGTTVNFLQAGSPTDFTAGTDKNILETNQVGANIKWDATENLQIDADISYSKSRLNPDGNVSSEGADIGYGGLLGTTLGVRVTGDSKKHFPELTTYGPQGNQALWTDQAILGSHVTVRMAQKNSDEIKQFRLGATWKQDDLTIKVGARYMEDEFALENRNTFANNYWQAYAGYGAPSGRTSGVPIPASLIQGTISTKGWIPGFKGNLPPVLLDYDARAYQQYLESLWQGPTNTPGYNAGCCAGFNGTIDLALDPGSVQNIVEKSWSAWVSVNFNTDVAGMPFHFNAGAREEITKVISTGIGRVPTSITGSAADPTLLTVAFSDSQAVTESSSYSYFLPALDMKLELTDSLHLRFDASRTLTRPRLDYLGPVLNVGAGQRVGALTATGNNPFLKPYLADNFDLGLEWYYQRNSYASVNLFLKDVANFIVAGTQRQTINNVIDPTTGQAAIFTVSARVNGPEATVKGVELAWQHVFGDSGFGFNANATFVETNKPYDSSNLSQSGFAVTGLANSANLVAFYDKNGFEFRTAVNWRDKYLLQFGQAQNNSAFGAEPTFVNSALQIDLSTNIRLTDQISVFGEALNITNETYSTHGRFSNQLLDVYGYGRRFTAGVRYRF